METTALAHDKFKTQVLLLHSEQSTLENLSSGFSDHYTVHFATSGSEALNTLVATPINVMVSAQDLPGMSGLDALREAKKRSPDTIGILLAGDSADGLEAMVGEKEVFEIVRGNVTSDLLQELVETATRQVRMLALADSANDNAANPDEPVAQHIVMETSDNGAAIISDVTGQVPTLDAKSTTQTTSVGSRSVDILVVTQDQEFLETINKSSKGLHTVHYANTLAQADDSIRKYSVGVAIVDAAMVGDKVEKLTLHLRKGSSRLVCIVAGRRDDGEMLMDLINRGKVYRFLLKPVSPGRARLAVEASVKHHLEAPNVAFNSKDLPQKAKSAKNAAPGPAEKRVAKSKAPPKPAAKKEPVKSAGATVKSVQSESVASRSAVPLRASITNSPIDDRLADAFGQDDSSFTETVTGLVSAVTGRFTSTEISAADAVKSGPASENSAGSGGSVLKSPKILGFGAATIAVVAVTILWITGGSDDPGMTREAAVESPLVPETNVPVDPIPTAALDADPEDAAILGQPSDGLEAALGAAEAAILASNFDAARSALEQAAAVDPDNVRLPFLTAQLSQTQLRAHLDEARSAIRESRFEDAEIALIAANGLDGVDATEIDAFAAELDAALSQQRTAEVLTSANEKLESGALVTPANDNARYYFKLVLSDDPQNVAAQQGLNIIASKLVLQAQSELSDGNLNNAEDLLAEARATDGSNGEISAADTALANARAAIIERQRQAEIAASLEAKRLEQAAQAAQAEREAAAALKAKLQLEADAIREAEAKASAAVDQSGDAAQAQENDSVIAVAKLEPQIAIEESDSGSTEAIDQQPESTATLVVPLNKNPVAVSSLNRIKYVAPKYPRSAQRRNQAGWVDIVFVVSLDGTVKDIDIRSSQPGETFVASAIRAVEKWKFEPIIENGVLVEKRAGVRMMFALE